jgi:hypothetical protein
LLHKIAFRWFLYHITNDVTTWIKLEHSALLLSVEGILTNKIEFFLRWSNVNLKEKMTELRYVLVQRKNSDVQMEYYVPELIVYQQVKSGVLKPCTVCTVHGTSTAM